MTDDVDALTAIGMLVGIVFGGLSAGILTWMYAPPVGGEFWPYIRVGATLVAMAVGAKLGIILVAIGAILIAGVLIVLSEVVQ